MVRGRGREEEGRGEREEEMEGVASQGFRTSRFGRSLGTAVGGKLVQQTFSEICSEF